jgi:hypothetical protein
LILVGLGPCDELFKCDSNGNVTFLNLATISLNTTVPTELGALTALTELNIGTCNLTGPVPSELERLSLLRQLFIDNNNLTSAPKLGQMGRLEKLFVQQNPYLRSTVPSEWIALTSLKELDFSSCSFLGTMPSWKALTRLEVFRAHGNNLEGRAEFPEALRKGTCTLFDNCIRDCALCECTPHREGCIFTTTDIRTVGVSTNSTTIETTTSDSVSSTNSASIATTSEGGMTMTRASSFMTSESVSVLESPSSKGAIVGGVVGGVALLALIGGGAWFFLRRRPTPAVDNATQSQHGSIVEAKSHSDYAPIKIAHGDYDQGRVELPAESEYNHGRIL